MARVEIIGGEELKRKLADLNIAIERVLHDAVLAGEEIIEAEMERKAPGPYVAWKLIKLTDTRAEIAIGPDKEHWYYQFFETGVQPHEVHPKNRKALAGWEYGGEEMFAKVTNPRGFPAAPFIRPGMENTKDETVAAMGSEFLGTINKVVK